MARFEDSYVLPDSFKVCLYPGRWFGRISHAESSCPFSRHSAGTFRMSLRVTFKFVDITRPNVEEFTLSRELRGRATLPSNRVDRAQPQGVLS
jgi:hypothetical protein